MKKKLDRNSKIVYNTPDMRTKLNIARRIYHRTMLFLGSCILWFIILGIFVVLPLYYFVFTAPCNI